jgi:hypothetical protein
MPPRRFKWDPLEQGKPRPVIRRACQHCGAEVKYDTAAKAMRCTDVRCRAVQPTR